MTFNTGNPIGSTDARDLSDNAENFDKALGTLSPTWTDRLGVTRDSFEGRLAKGSFYRVGTFAAGYTLTNMRQTLEYNGHEYSWAGTFPKVVAAGATPATSGGIGAGAWVDRTDLTLRSDLSSSNGSSNIGFSVSETVEDVLLSLNVRKNNTICISDYNLGSDTANFAAAISAANSDTLYTARVIEIPAGEYTITSGFVVEPYVAFKSLGVVRINYTGTGVMFDVKYSSTTDPSGDTNGMTQNANNNHNLFDGSSGAIQIVGSGKASGQTAISFGDALAASSSSRHTAWLSVSNIFIDKFQYGINFNPKNVFIMRFYNVNISGCGVCLNSPLVSNTNAGEQIDWFGCAFHNSDRIMYSGCQMNMEFHGCSFDYGVANQSAMLIEADYQRLSFVGGWVEAPNGQEQSLVESAGGSPLRFHVGVENVYFHPRDKRQCTLFKGPMSLSFVGNTFVVNRFNNFPNSSLGTHHYICDDAVKIVHANGNRYFDQMVGIGRNNVINRNADFELSANGTTANSGAPTAITGWTHQGGAGSTDVVIDNTQFNSGTRSLKITTTGTYATMLSDKVPVLGRRVYCGVVIYSPLDASLTVNMQVNFHDVAGAILSSTTTNTSHTDYPASWVSNKSGVYAEVPKGTFSVSYQILFGSFTSAFWVDDMSIEFV